MMRVDKSIFGYIEKKEVNSYTIKNSNGIKISFINYGGRITHICTPDKNGKVENIVLGYDTIEDYIEESRYFGALVGRISGRIKGAEFKLDGKTYKLNKNEGNNHLHGGLKSFSNVLWDSEIVENANEASVVFSYTSVDGEEGFPGTVNIKATYLLNENNELVVTYEGATDKKTLINMTNHSYFNLSGNLKRDVLNHTIKIDSDKFIELDLESIPTGKLLDVNNTPFDLRNGNVLKESLSQSHDQLTIGLNGIDHPFVLNSNFNKEIIFADEESGRTLTIETNQKSVVLYTSNHFEGDFYVRGVKAVKHLGACLETQGLPDAINNENFPQVTVDKDEVYSAKTKYVFGTI
jgi:aldose 1-epimerase